MSRNRMMFLLCCALSLAACQDKKAAAPEIKPVRTMIADPRPLEDDRRAIGEIRPRHEAELGFLVSGKIIARVVDLGDSVKQGDVIARLDDADYRNRLKSAEADYTAAGAVLAESQAAEDRSRQLLASGSTTRATYDAALKNMRSAEARAESAKAAMDLAADQLRYAELHAEHDGIITAVGAEAGQVVSAGRMIVKVAGPDEKDAVFSIAESVFGDRKVDEQAEVVVGLLSNPAASVEGTVREISPIADPSTRTYLVKVTLKDPPEQMRFGASVVGKRKAALTPCVVVPASALFDKDGQPAVWIVNPNDGVLELKTVVVARYETDRVVISDGLAKGDVVVTAGVNRLRERQKVRLAEGGLQ